MRPSTTVVASLLLTPALAALTVLAAPAHAEYRSEKRLPIAAGGSFSLRAESGGVTVRGVEAAAGQEAVITIHSDRDDFAEKYTVRYETPRPDRVEVVIERKSRGPSGWFGEAFGSRTRVEVTLPRNAAAEIESSGGGIEISGLDGAVTAESSGGGVRASDLGGSAKLSSSGGSIQAERIAGDLDASSSGGGVRIDEAGGAVTAESSGGSVSVGFAAGNGRGGRLNSSGGGVKARVDPGVGLEIDAASSGGSVSCDLPVTVRGKVGRDSLHGKLNAGGSLLKLRSSGGGVTLSGI